MPARIAVYWTIRQETQLAVGQVEDWITCRLDDSRTCQLVKMLNAKFGERK